MARYQAEYSILGDAAELFREIAEDKGYRFACIWYWVQTLAAIPLYFYHVIFWSMVMWKNYLVSALRNLGKNKGFSFINIAGLAVGMACCLLILLYIQDELSYDRYHENADRIYRATREWFNSDGTTSLHLGMVAPPFKDLLVTDFGEIEEAVRLLAIGGMVVSFGDKSFREDRFFFAEQNVFKIFSFPMIAGNPETALRDPGTVVITRSFARKYFGDGDPMGNVLDLDVLGIKASLMVTGVTEDVPENAHFHYDMLGSFKTYEAIGTDLDSFGSNNYATYLLMPEGYDIRKLQAAMPEFIDRHMGQDMHTRTMLHFQMVTDIHLHSHLDSELEPNSDIKYIYIFGAIAFFVLLIACINFMNLATARSAGRAREVGLRKVIGAARSQLISQFLGETVLIAVLALAAAIILVLLALPWFRDFTGKSLALTAGNSLFIIGSMVGITLFVGFIAGSYPALYLSSFRPALVLRGMLGAGGRSTRFRTVLVVMQFAVSIALIVCMSIVYEQLDYVRNKRLGFDEERIVMIRGTDEMIRRHDAIRDRLMAHPVVVNVAASKRVPSGRLLDSSGSRIFREGTAESVEFRIAFIPVAFDFFSTYRMEIAAGRDFSREFPSDSTHAFILNETAVRGIGWTPEEAVNQEFGYGNRRGTIIGVVKDFHFESMHQPISPIVFFIRESNINTFSIRLAPRDIPGALAFLEGVWREYMPKYPFEYAFIDERFDRQYRAEEKLGRLFGYFSVLAVVIACLGLFGLASYTAERRRKEIGVRKVLGASVSSIVRLLAFEFGRLVLIANIIAWPVAYFAMERWLRDFAYRTDIGLTSFVAAAAAALVIALATVSFQAVKAAVADPVDAIKFE